MILMNVFFCITALLFEFFHVEPSAFWWLIRGIQTILLWLVYSHSILITQNIFFYVRKITSVDSIQIKPNSSYVPI